MTWQALLDPFGYQFFVQGLVAAVLAGALCGLIGVHVTLRGMSYIGHGLSHAVFGGYAAAPLLGVPVLLGAGAWGLASALAIDALSRTRRIRADAAIGVVTTASFALGVALLTRFGSRGPSFEALLFGSINGVSRADLLLLGGVLLLAAATLTAFHRPLLFATFDPEVADVSGVRVRRMDTLLMVVLSLSVLATLKILGVTLVAATLVIPAVVARMACDSFGRILWLSTLLGAAAGGVGMYLSFQLAIPSGTTIVLVNALAFLVVLIATGGRSLRRAGVRAGAAGARTPAPLLDPVR
jgi:ABC-type Mn2+/Zn2+ transport system permease subunit